MVPSCCYHIRGDYVGMVSLKGTGSKISRAIIDLSTTPLEILDPSPLSPSLPLSLSPPSLPFSEQLFYLYHFDDISWSKDSWIKLHMTSTSCQSNNSFLYPLVAE